MHGKIGENDKVNANPTLHVKTRIQLGNEPDWKLAQLSTKIDRLSELQSGREPNYNPNVLTIFDNSSKFKNQIIKIMKNIGITLCLVFSLFWTGSVLAQESVEKSKAELAEEKKAVAKMKADEKAAAAEEKKRIAGEKAEEKRIKSLEVAQKNYDKALTEKQNAEIKLAKKNLAIEKAIQKGKATDADIAKMKLDLKKIEIAIQQASADMDKFQRDITRNTKDIPKVEEVVEEKH